MRRPACILLSLMLLFLTACGSTPPSPGADGPSQPEVPAQQETPPPRSRSLSRSRSHTPSWTPL